MTFRMVHTKFSRFIDCLKLGKLAIVSYLHVLVISLSVQTALTWNKNFFQLSSIVFWFLSSSFLILVMCSIQFNLLSNVIPKYFSSVILGIYDDCLTVWNVMCNTFLSAISEANLRLNTSDIVNNLKL